MRGLETRLINIAGVAASLFSWVPSRQSAFTGHCAHDTHITNVYTYIFLSLSPLIPWFRLGLGPDVQCGCDLNVNTKIRDRWPAEKYNADASCTVVKDTWKHMMGSLLNLIHFACGSRIRIYHSERYILFRIAICRVFVPV